MKAGNLIFSAVQLIFVALVLLLGLFFVGLEHVSHLRFAIADFFLQEPMRFSFVGYLILGCGILLLVGFYVMHRGVYYKIKMGKHDALVDPAVVQQYVKIYWDSVFPDKNLSVDVRFSHDQKMELCVEMPLLAPENHKGVLEKVEGDLGKILEKHLGYRREFLLSVLIK